MSNYRPQRSCEDYVFTGVCLSTGVSALGGAWSWGVCSGGMPGPGGCLLPVGAWSRGVGIPACTEADPPWERRLLLRTVRILLECILVF